MLEKLVNYLINVDHKYLKKALFLIFTKMKKNKNSGSCQIYFSVKRGTLSKEEINKSI